MWPSYKLDKDFKFIEIGIWEDGSCAANVIGYANNAEIDKYGKLNAKLKVDYDIGLFNIEETAQLVDLGHDLCINFGIEFAKAVEVGELSVSDTYFMLNM